VADDLDALLDQFDPQKKAAGDDIDALLDQYDPGSDPGSTPEPAAFGRPDPERYRRDLAQGFKSALAGAVGLPFLDRALAGGEALLDSLALPGHEVPGEAHGAERYGQNLEGIRGFVEEGRRANPAAAFAGSLLTPAPVPPVGGLVTRIPGLGGAAGEVIARVLEGAGAGALQSVSAAPDLTNTQDVVARAESGGTVGGTLGGALAIPAALLRSALGGQPAQIAGREARTADAQAVLERAEVRRGAGLYERELEAGRGGAEREAAERATAETERLRAQAQQRAVEETARRRAATAAENEFGPDTAVRYFGLDDAGGQLRLGGPRNARGAAMQIAYSEVPDGGGLLYRDLATMPAEQAMPRVVKAREAVGARLGEIREQVAAAGVNTPLDQALAAVRGVAKPDASAGVQSALAEAEEQLQRAAGEGAEALSPGQLRAAIESIEEAASLEKTPLGRVRADREGRALTDARRALVGLEKEAVKAGAPGRFAEYEALLPQYATARTVERGIERKLGAVNRGRAEVGGLAPEPRAVRPEAVAAVRPEAVPSGAPFPRPPSARDPFETGPQRGLTEGAVARRATQPEPNALQRLVPSLAGLAGGALGRDFAGGYGAVAGGSLGYQLGSRAAQRLFPLVRPTTGQVVELSERSAQTLARYGPVIETLARGGARAAQAWHRAMLQTDPEYRAVFDEQSGGGRAAQPLSYEEYFRSFKGGENGP